MTRDRSRERDRLKVRYEYRDPYHTQALERARSMCSYMSDARISDYLGMVIEQVREIRAAATLKRLGRPPLKQDSDFARNLGSGAIEARERLNDAVRGSERLLEAIRRVA